MASQKLVKNIPCINAGHLPPQVHTELENWDDELCFHGDGGCVFYIWEHTLTKIPQFITWMKEIGAWTEEQTSELKGYESHLAVAMTGT